MAHKVESTIRWNTVLLVFGIALLGGARWWWVQPTEWETNARRDPAAAESLPPSLATIRMELDRVQDQAVSRVITAAARIALPLLIARLDLEADVKKRLNDRLAKSDFGDRIVPFLMNSVELYEPMGARVPKTFREVMLPKFSPIDLKRTPWLEHALFHVVDPVVKTDPVKAKSSGLSAKKALVTTILRLYDALYLQTGMTVGEKTRPLTATQRAAIETTFVSILKTLQTAEKDNPEINDGINGILKDKDKLETITGSVSRFVYEFLERHYQVYIQPIRREQALRAWAEGRLQAFFDSKDDKLFNHLDWEAKNKKYAVQFIVDGLQGNLLEALTGNNPTFLAKIAEEHRNRARFKPVGENTAALPVTQNTYLEWVAGDQRRLADPLYLPFFKWLYRDSRNSLTRDGISTTPTISVRNLPIVMSGYDVVGEKGGTGVPNFHYVDRKGVDRPDRVARAYYFFGNDAILLPEITRNAGMKTMFQRVDALGLDSISCHTPYDTGATVAFDPFLNLSIGEKVRDFGELNCLSELSNRAQAEADLQKVRAHLLKLFHDYSKVTGTSWLSIASRKLVEMHLRDSLKQYILLSQKGLPSFLQIYSPWPDHFAHFQGPFSDAIISPSGELNRLDHWLSFVQHLYQTAALDSRTQFGMAGDHGLTPVYTALNPEKEVFARYEKETGTALKILKISSDEGEGPKVNNPDHPSSVKGYDLVIASTAGGNYMVDAFVGQDDKNWSRQPVFSELRKLRTLGGKTIDLIQVITSHLPTSLDYLVVRDSECGRGACDFSLAAMRDGKFIRERIYRKGDRIFYHPTADLLEVGAITPYRKVEADELRQHAELHAKCVERAEFKAPDSWCMADEWRRLAQTTPRPDSVVQVAHLYDSDKAGTINLFPRQGVGYNTIVPGRHAGEHFHEKDAFVGFWGSGTQRSHRIESAVNGSVAPTLMEWISPAALSAGDFGFPVVGDGP